jgi:hypothetical protein
MGWQDAVAIAVVFGAAFYLCSLAWKGMIGGKGGGGSCGTSCGKCSSNAGASLASGAAAPGMVVSIGAPPGRTAPAQAEPADAR